MSGKLVVLAAVIAAVAIIGGYAALGHGDDSGDSEESGKTTLEYSLEVVPRVDCWDLDISFYAPESGSYWIYLGSDLIAHESWEGPDHISRGYVTMGTDYDIDLIEASIDVRFSSNFDAVRV